MLGFILVILLIPVLLLVGLFWAPPELLARWAESGSARFTDTELELDSLDVAWFDDGPGVALNGFSVAQPLLEGESAEAVLDASQLLRARLVMDHVMLRDVDVDLKRDGQGRWNWQSLLDSRTTDESSATADQETGDPAVSLPAIRQIDISDVRIALDDRVLDRQGAATVSVEGSTTDAEIPTRLVANGELDGLPVELDISVNPLARLSVSLDDLTLDAQAVAGQTQVSLQGTVGNPSTLSSLDLTFTAEAPDLQDVQALSRVGMPTLPPWRIQGELARDGIDWVLERFDGRVGDSDLQGDVRMDVMTSPVTVYANLISTTLDLDDLAGLFGGVPDPDESATTEQQQRAEKRETDDRLLPDEPLALAGLTEYFTGAVEYRAETVRSPDWPIEFLDTRIEVDEGKADVVRLKIDAAEGFIDGEARLDATVEPTVGEFELQVNAVNLRTIMSTLGIDDDSFGRIGGNVRFWFEGDTLAQIAASLDGGLFMLMTEGKVDALLVELSGLDVVESVFLAIDPGKTLSTIDCAYLDIQAEDGIADIARLVVDSNDTVYVGDGEVDLNDESLDIAVEPHPKDLSILSAQTSVRVRGTVGDMQVIPGEELALRAASATLLGALATPLAALLPLVQTGEGEDSAYCDGLMGALDQAAEEDQ